MYRLAQEFRVRFWGTRGSIPAPGPGTVKYGGNTACVEVRCGEEMIILDAGTGIKELGTRLLKETPLSASILFSHMHWDHIQGIPFFRPLYIPGNSFRLYGSKSWDTRLEYALRWQMRSPSIPLTFEDLSRVGARMVYVDISAGDAFRIGKNGQVTVRSIELNHPDKAFGFRIEYNGRSIVYATDNESLPHPDEKLVELAHECYALKVR